MASDHDSKLQYQNNIIQIPKLILLLPGPAAARETLNLLVTIRTIYVGLEKNFLSDVDKEITTLLAYPGVLFTNLPHQIARMKEILLKSVAGPNVHPACSDECVLKNMLQKNITLVVRMAEYAVGTTLAVELFDMVVDWTLSAEGIPFKHVRDAEGRWQLRNCPCSSKAMLDDLQFNVERAKVIGLTKKGSSRLPDPNVIPIICSYIKI